MRLIEEPPELWIGRLGIDLEPAKILNRRVRGRTLQVLIYPHPAAWSRGRGHWPRSGLWPILRYWRLGPLGVHRFTRPTDRRRR